MGTVDIGLTCADCGHFNNAFILYEPITDRDIDRQGEKRPRPTECGKCGSSLEAVLLSAEDRPREGPLTRKGLARKPLKRSSKPRPKEGPLSPSEWRRRAFDRQRPAPGQPALCAVTGEQLNESIDHVHHPLDKRLLRARGLYSRVWDPRNSMAVKRHIHVDHTSGMFRIPREALPAEVWDFAKEIGEWAVARIEADHPVTAKV